MAEQASSLPAGGRRRLIAFSAVYFIVSLLFAWWCAEAMQRSAADGLEARGRQRLGLYASSLRNHLEKYEYLPAVLAQDGDVQMLLRGDGDADLPMAVNRRLERLNAAAHTSVLYVMDLTGMTLASSNWTEPTSFVGENYSFRPYFRDALAQGRGRYFGIGVTTGQPAFFFAEAVRGTDGAVIGAAVVRLDIEPLQREWEEAGETVLLADEFGVIFLSSRAEWRFTVLQPLDDADRAILAETKKYIGLALPPLPLTRSDDWHGTPLLEIGGMPYLRQEQPLRQDWQIFYLSDIAPAEVQGRLAASAALAGSALLALTLLFIRQYRLRQQAREAVANALRQARDELETRVAERTKDLQKQVQERERAERVLREAQDELVQAGKLAALGQMSAAIAHEINQPLTAIGTYAAAARLLVGRGDLGSVTANLAMIEDLTRRMAEITRHLKTFARKSAADPKPVSLQQVVRRALALLDSRFRLEKVELDVKVPDDAVVVADDIRLEQVMINLLRNACDAMAEAPVRQLAIHARRWENSWVLTVTDSGMGIAAEHMPHLFHPFFTTKPKGDGLGLGLAISHGIVHDFGGSLTAENASGGGAAFTLSLPAEIAATPRLRSVG